MACSISLPRASGDIATYVDPFQTSMFEAPPSETSRPYSPCNRCPREDDSPATSPANSRRSSPSSNPPFLQTEQRRGSYSCVKEDDCGTYRFCCLTPPEPTQAEFFTYHMLTCSVTLQAPHNPFSSQSLLPYTLQTPWKSHGLSPNSRPKTKPLSQTCRLQRYAALVGVCKVGNIHGHS